MLRITKAMKGEKGFTLIELMVVIAIIAVLVAIAIPAYVNATTNAKRNTCKANLRTIDGAINVYYAENSEYPTTVAQLVSAGELKEAPTEPFSGSAYTISSGSAVCPGGTDGVHTY